ncbi:nicotinamide N-methyltransferase-like [Ambystoma mexicanum]|uniref:nicotinamide N-methyltransferase-like n=1 Tax=Ambystoma mexicanum TaxID=8296 RepID=UPI0037E99435
MDKSLLEHKDSDLSLQEFLNKFLDGRKQWETYAGKESAFCDDTTIGPLTAMTKMFSSGGVKGNTLIQLSALPFNYYNFPACAYFTEIIFGTATDSCFREVEKWRKNETDAMDMSNFAQLVCDSEGNRQTWIEKEHLSRSKMRPVLIFDITKSNPFCPVVLPEADCLLLTHCLELYTTDKESFCSYLKNVSLLLKTGGHLLMVVALEITFYLVDNVKFPHLCFDVGFLRNAFTNIGYCIEDLQVFPRKLERLYDFTDYRAFAFLKARKET